MPAEPHASVEDDHHAVADFKEHVYVTFTGMAIVLTIDGVANPSPANAIWALVIGVVGVTLAALASDVIAQLAVHSAFPDVREFRSLLLIAASGLISAALPLAALIASALGWLDIETALVVAAFVYVAALGVVGVRAVWGAGLTTAQKVISFAMLGVVAAGVVIIEVLAHSH